MAYISVPPCTTPFCDRPDASSLGVAGSEVDSSKFGRLMASDMRQLGMRNGMAMSTTKGAQELMTQAFQALLKSSTCGDDETKDVLDADGHCEMDLSVPSATTLPERIFTVAMHLNVCIPWKLENERGKGRHAARQKGQRASMNSKRDRSEWLHHHRHSSAHVKSGMPQIPSISLTMRTE